MPASRPALRHSSFDPPLVLWTGSQAKCLPLIVELLLDLWAEIVQRQVSPASIVERFDVQEQVWPGLVMGTVLAVIYQVARERPDEALHRCIVLPTADAIHAGADTVSLQQGLIGMVRVVAALIGVVDEASLWLTSLDGQLQGGQRQIAGRTVRDVRADDAPGVQIQDDGQIQPPFLHRDVGDVGQSLVLPSAVQSRFQHQRFPLATPRFRSSCEPLPA